MKKKLLTLFVFCFLTNCFAVNTISLFGGICTPIKENDKKFFKNSPCIDLNYSFIFNSNVVLGTDISFFYQKENPEHLLFENYMIDFKTNIGYSFKFNYFNIIPQLFVGYSKYTFYDMTDIYPKRLNLFCYGTLIDFSYSLNNIVIILIRPEFIFYGNNYLSPIKLLTGFGINF